MTRADLIAALAAIERSLANLVVIMRVIVNPDGTEAKRIVRVVQPTINKETQP